ncbi:MAG: NAD-dependent epimerase/dehydratase family protein [Proteobacteria bacterium]|nr:NAD-dependent epimerase/dehydratase family protein [Pseudomonadota bacterium]
MERVLITGIAGGQGRLLTRRLLDNWAVCGVDDRRWEGHPRGVKVHRADLRKRKFEDILRTERPKAVVHMGFIRHFRDSERERHDVNVRGTRKLLDLCVRYGVERLVVVSSGYVYGAFPENPYRMDEEQALSASRAYPEIRDLVEVDTLATAFLWKFPQVRTSILRPVNVLGHYVDSMANRYLRQPRVPVVAGFDPMLQFLHEEDLSEAIALALEHGLQGVFNVVGPGEVPLHTAIEESGGRAVSVPEPVLRFAFERAFRWGLSSTPVGVLDYLKYPVTLDGDRFREATHFRPFYGLQEIFDSVRH